MKTQSPNSVLFILLPILRLTLIQWYPLVLPTVLLLYYVLLLRVTWDIFTTLPLDSISFARWLGSEVNGLVYIYLHLPIVTRISHWGCHCVSLPLSVICEVLEISSAISGLAAVEHDWMPDKSAPQGSVSLGCVFSTSALPTFGANSVGRGCPVHHRMFSNIPNLYPVCTSTRHCQMSRLTQLI